MTISTRITAHQADEVGRNSWRPTSDLIQIEALRERDRLSVVQTRLRTLPVVEDFDVFADRVARLLAGEEALMIDQFVRLR